MLLKINVTWLRRYELDCLKNKQNKNPAPWGIAGNWKLKIYKEFWHAIVEQQLVIEAIINA